MCVKLPPRLIHFPLSDIWSTHFQWSWKLQERGHPRRTDPFKNECAPRHLLLAFPYDPALIFVFLWHYPSQPANLQIAHSRVHAAVAQSRGCVSLGAKPARSGHRHPFSSLENPRHTLWEPAGTQGWKVKTLLFIKPGQKGDESPDGAKFLSFTSRPYGGNANNKPAAPAPASECGLRTEGREQKRGGMRQKTSDSIVARGDECGGRRLVISSCFAAAAGWF